MVVYIITWRGLAALLILDWGQCEGLDAGMGRSRNSHAFFVSAKVTIIFQTAVFYNAVLTVSER